MGKRVAFTAGLAALVVILFGGICWRELAVQYFMTRFRSEPGRFIVAIDQPQGSIQAEAVKRVVASGDWPAKAVLQFYLAELARIRDDFRDSLESADTDEAQFFIRDSGVLEFNYLVDFPGWAIHGSGFSGKLSSEVEVRRLTTIQDLLAEAHFICSSIPDHPGIEFTFFKDGEPYSDKSIDPFAQNKPVKETCCLIQWPERIRIKEEEYQKRLSEMSVRMMTDLKKRQLPSLQTK